MMATDPRKIDDAVLALLSLTLHDQSHASRGFAPEVLRRLHEQDLIEEPDDSSDSVELTPDGLQRSKTLFNAMFGAPSAPAASTEPSGPAKYPAISVDLADLNGDMWPILRRVSYAMSDADVDESDIEQYKSDMKDGSDPVAVSRRWVSVQ